jgi:hypothetical protein
MSAESDICAQGIPLTSPSSGVTLESNTLTPNMLLRSRIREWQQQQKERKQQLQPSQQHPHRA